MTEGQKTILAIRRAAVGEALSVWLNTPISIPMAERMEIALAAYERALIRPIAEAPNDETEIFVFDGFHWWKSNWENKHHAWFLFSPDMVEAPTHFRPPLLNPEVWAWPSQEAANAK